MHGGTHPKGGAAPQALQRLKHGLFAKTLTPDEEAAFHDALMEALEDPTKAMLADAQFLRVKAATVAKRADATGMYTGKQSAVKRTEPIIDQNTGRPMFYRTDDGESKPAVTVTETVSAERCDVIGPVSELLMRAARLTEASVMLKKKAGLVGDEEVGSLDEETMADILRREFNDAGALHREDDDGPEKSTGAGGSRQGG